MKAKVSSTLFIAKQWWPIFHQNRGWNFSIDSISNFSHKLERQTTLLNGQSLSLSHTHTQQAHNNAHTHAHQRMHTNAHHPHPPTQASTLIHSPTRMHNTKLLFLSLSFTHTYSLYLYLGVSHSQRLYLFLPFNLLSFCRPIFLLSLHRCPLQSFSPSHSLLFSLYVSLTIPTLLYLSLSLSFPNNISL